jgi:hypothetical protein
MSLELWWLFFTILHLVPGGWETVCTVAGQAGKFRVLDLSFNFTTTYTFWSGVIGGTFLVTASHGTDQLYCAEIAYGAQ